PDAAAAEQAGADQEALEPGGDELRPDARVGDRARADRARRPGAQRRLEHGAADVDVAGRALARVDVLVVDRDNALVGMDDAGELLLVDDLDEGREPVGER